MVGRGAYDSGNRLFSIALFAFMRSDMKSQGIHVAFFSVYQ